MPLFTLGHPSLDAVSQKALQLPIINPFDRHGRIFFFAWLSFLLSFLSWYSLPPLLNVTIKKDMNLTDGQVANSNIIAGVASLLVRLVAGPLCDRFGPRYVLVATLWLSALPCGLAGTAMSVNGLYAIRFFMGIAGAAFVPCQCLMAAWFDKQVIGTASAFAAGWGDSGVGITFFVMPAIFNSLVSSHGHDERVAWRLSFIVPCVLLLACGALVLIFNEDTPTGPWATRNLDSRNIRRGSGTLSNIRSTNSSLTVFGPFQPGSGVKHIKSMPSSSDLEKGASSVAVTRRGSEATMLDEYDTAPPQSQPAQSFGSGLKDLACMQTFMLAAGYFATFGTCLTVNSILVSWYINKFGWDQTRAGNWAAMFGLLNIVARPVGGIMGDVLYRRLDERRGLLAKKFWLSSLCVLGGILALLTGLLDLNPAPSFIALVSVLAFVVEAGNGACYALLPHVNPHINGLMGGVVGGSGNLGGIIFSTIARFATTPQTVWIIGIFGISIGSIISFINPSVSSTSSSKRLSPQTTFVN
ncbi:uncharacterized protein JCM6883_005251 [Sporobolomyces salmoneus]|uniref:uncharacterized protein n=1 Tax=Sporobolomyces salmoneus TaxID=183962 RepID=UPI003181BCC3